VIQHHTEGDRPLVLTPDDLPRVEAVPLAERDLPTSTYALLARSAERHADAPAIHLLGEGGVHWREAPSLTYAELFAGVRRAANLYADLGLSPQGVVGIMAPNTGATYTALLGAQAVGVANPVNPMLATEHIVEILSLTGAEILVAAGPDLAPAVWKKAKEVAARLPRLHALVAMGAPEVAPDGPAGKLLVGDFARLTADQPADVLHGFQVPKPEDIAAYFHTGGTTGKPKVAPHTHANEVYMAWALGCSGGYMDNSVMLSGLPLFHVNAVHVTGLAPFMHGRPIVSLGPRGYRDKQLMADFWHIISHFRISSFSGVPTLYASLPPVPEGVDISSLRAGAVGAAPLPPTVRTDFETSTKVPMLEGYGLTEATCASASMPALAPRKGSVGLRLAYQQIKAVQIDPDTEAPIADVPTGETGVLAVKGPSVFPGYLREDAAGGTSPDPAGKIFDGWLITGDLGRVDEDGYVYLTGRSKDMIIRGGHNIDPLPVEESLLLHPEITGAAVVPGPDAHSGEVPIAYVTLAPGSSADPEELQEWASKHAPEPVAAPKAVHVIDAIPLTTVGKVFKPQLVADAIRRVVEEEIQRCETFASVTMDVLGKRPRAVITAEGDTSLLARELERYAFDFSIN
jgi:fatty-acyl-CoA synthase